MHWLIIAPALALGPANAHDWTIGRDTVSLSVVSGIGGFVESNANFGAGSFDIRTVRDFAEGRRLDAGMQIPSPAWGEGFLKPVVTASHAFNSDFSLLGGFSVVAAKTFGDGDASPYSLTAGQPGSIGFDEAYVGAKLPLPFGISGDSIVVKFGRQDFSIDDGFLVQLGRYDIGRSADLYLYPHTAFDGWGTIRINSSPVRADIFVLQADVNNSRAYGDAHFALDQPATHFAGVDVEWFQNVPTKGANGAVNYLDRKRYLNFTYFNIFSADSNPALYSERGIFWDRRDGLNVYSVAGGGNLIPIKDSTLYFQHVWEINNHPDRKVYAKAFYVEPGYTFTRLPWTPHVYYRYSYFSGQPGLPGSPEGTKRNYDILFLGGGIRNFFGNYGLGEIIGNMTTITSNLIVQNVSVKLTAPFHLWRLSDSLVFEVLGYAYTLDYPLRVGASSSGYGHEVDLTSTYNLDANTSMSFVTGVAIPEHGGLETVAALTAGLPGARPVQGNSYIVEAFILHTF